MPLEVQPDGRLSTFCIGACIHQFVKGIEKYFNCLIEAYTVLRNICGRFVAVPDKTIILPGNKDIYEPYRTTSGPHHRG